MTYELFFAICLFALVTTGTPGPNNIMFTSSGANFGFRKTIPHMLGVNLGLNSLHLLMGLGLGAVFIQLPILQNILKVLGSAYLLWLAWKMLGNSIAAATNTPIPLTMLQAATFQYVNPKAWVMAIGANVSFSLEGDLYSASVVAIIGAYFLVGPCTNACWVIFGKAIGRYLSSPQRLKLFNIIMAGLTASCVWFIWL
ncbi:MAG TPA: LysE family translocator [Oceanospirillaceae bacterium]|jgi:threonine/homoserine/homoserine lactone efflux protein|nr:LysE family translocator [Oceanospirillaceae bacterium]